MGVAHSKLLQYVTIDCAYNLILVNVINAYINAHGVKALLSTSS